MLRNLYNKNDVTAYVNLFLDLNQKDDSIIKQNSLFFKV